VPIQTTSRRGAPPAIDGEDENLMIKERHLLLDRRVLTGNEPRQPLRVSINDISGRGWLVLV
jgi:hypothetical protein